MKGKQVEIDSAGLTINGEPFCTPMTPVEMNRFIGEESRVVETAPPAPYGHRNNQLHLYDRFGIRCIEHHATGLISSIEFILSQHPDRPNLPGPKNPFRGTIRLGSLEVDEDTPEEAILLLTGLGFQRFLPGVLSVRNETMYACAEIARRTGLLESLSVSIRSTPDGPAAESSTPPCVPPSAPTS